MFGKHLQTARKNAGLSQEQFAEILGISRQSIQKWECGTSLPDIRHLKGIAHCLGCSLDMLLADDAKVNDELFLTNRAITPTYEKMSSWDAYCKCLNQEYIQCRDEGKEIERYQKLFEAVAAIPDSEEKNKMADILYSIAMSAPQKQNYAYSEPSDIEQIRLRRDGYICQMTKPDATSIADRIYGGWLGRICGCLLGKPMEGIRTDEFYRLLKRINNYPLKGYVFQESISEEDVADINFPILPRAYTKSFGKMPYDDDTNYTVMAHKIVEEYGRDFRAEDVGKAWLHYQPKEAYCTAERVAYINLVNSYQPPNSAIHKNVYREWIGAQIRGDYFGYINPCAPETAADMAFRDASISHVKNGIYGEMWVSAMIACAFGCVNIEDAIRGGLTQIPKTSRLYAKIQEVLTGYRDGITCADCMSKIHADWNEYSENDWCHTISNAEIVAASLLYGGGDYAKSVCLAVEQGFDTDCNSATVGSVLGVFAGIAAIPAAFSEPVCDTLETTLFGVGTVSIKQISEDTLRHLTR